MLEENKAVVLGCWESANRKDEAGFDKYYHENVVLHTTDGEISGRDKVKEYLMGFITAMPDLDLQVEDIFGEGDRIFSRARLRGTNTGQLWGAPPTGRSVDVGWIMNVARVQDGKIVEEWEVVDQLAIMRQLGLLETSAVGTAS